MNRLAQQLKSALESAGVTRSEVCSHCDIEPAALSKYLNGKMHPRKNVLGRLITIISEEDIPRVYAAYLLDMLPDGGEDYISIRENTQNSQDSTKVQEPDTVYKAGNKLPLELEKAFSFLRETAGKSPAVADSILSTYHVMKGVDLDKISE